VTKYLDSGSFSVGGYSPEGRANFDRIFRGALMDSPWPYACGGSGSRGPDGYCRRVRGHDGECDYEYPELDPPEPEGMALRRRLRHFIEAEGEHYASAPDAVVDGIMHILRDTLPDEPAFGVTVCPSCGGTEVVPASGPGTKGQLVMPCPQCTAKEGE
jgi:hypothetical protein